MRFAQEVSYPVMFVPIEHTAVAVRGAFPGLLIAGVNPQISNAAPAKPVFRVRAGASKNKNILYKRNDPTTKDNNLRTVSTGPEARRIRFRGEHA